MENTTFLELRKNSIGGTDISAICGINPYKDASDIYIEKILGKEEEENEYTIAGHLFEEVLGKRFEKATGLKVKKPSEVNIIKRKGYFHASIDYYCEDFQGELAIVECKTTSKYFKDRDDFFEKFPHYYMQVQWYMYIYGYRRAYFSIYSFQFAPQYHWFDVEYNENYVKMAVERAKEFWETHIEQLIPPPFTNSSQMNICNNFLVEKNIFEADEDDFNLFNELTDIKEELKVLEKKKKEIEEKFKLKIGTNEGIKYNDKILATYKTQIRNDLDKKLFKEKDPDLYELYSKESISRTLRIKEKAFDK